MKLYAMATCPITGQKFKSLLFRKRASELQYAFTKYIRNRQGMKSLTDAERADLYRHGLSNLSDADIANVIGRQRVFWWDAKVQGWLDPFRRLPGRIQRLAKPPDPTPKKCATYPVVAIVLTDGDGKKFYRCPISGFVFETKAVFDAHVAGIVQQQSAAGLVHCPVALRKRVYQAGDNPRPVAAKGYQDGDHFREIGQIVYRRGVKEHWQAACKIKSVVLTDRGTAVITVRNNLGDEFEVFANQLTNRVLFERAMAGGSDE